MPFCNIKISVQYSVIRNIRFAIYQSYDSILCIKLSICIYGLNHWTTTIIWQGIDYRNHMNRFDTPKNWFTVTCFTCKRIVWSHQVRYLNKWGDWCIGSLLRWVLGFHELQKLISSNPHHLQYKQGSSLLDDMIHRTTIHLGLK